MVQRKAINKFGIQTDSKNYVKSENRSTSLQLPSSQHQDIKNMGGTELKKIMKKSRSIKRADFEALVSSSPVRRAKSRLDTTPTKPSVIKKSDSSPNYMKPTSSSDARREHLQVSPCNSQTTGSSRKSSSRKGSNYLKTCDSSGHKPVKTLTKTSSLKPIRTLTKMSSFKTLRPSTKNSGVPLIQNIDMGRATCSSTLKDSKFPPYVMLEPGGTESEGSSIFKVCPYTYCSLNGHHHAPLPPLKRFLSARRHMLKTQKSTRMKTASRDRKPLTSLETDAACLDISPFIEEAGGFFVEIFAKPREDTAQSIGRNINSRVDEKVMDFPINSEILDDILLSVRDEENDDGKFSKSFPDESSYSEISFKDNLDQDGDFLMSEVDIGMIVPEYDQKVQVVQEDNLPCLIHAETGLESDCGSPATFFHEEMDASFDTEYDSDKASDIEDEFEKAAATSDEQDEDIDIVSSPASIEIWLGELIEASGENGELVQDNFPLGDDKPCFTIDGVYETDEKESDALHGDPEDNEESQQNEDNEGFLLKGQTSEFDSETDQDEATSNIYPKQVLPCVAVRDEVEEKEQVQDTNELHGFQITDSCQDFLQMQQETAKEEQSSSQGNAIGEDKKLARVVDESLLPVTKNHPFHYQADISTIVECQELTEKDRVEIVDSTEFTENCGSEEKISSSADEIVGEIENTQTEDSMEVDATETYLIENNSTGRNEAEAIINGDQLPKDCSKMKGTIRGKRLVKHLEEPRKFNPREPRYLPAQPDLEAETVDLRHQMMDERKNEEEWMLDFALRRAVGTLAPARKRRVALLVEAFETVMPLPKYEAHLQHTTQAFAHGRPIQACS